jgi:hypothetical protein
MVVAYRSITMYYKICAPSSEAIKAFEENLLKGGGHDLTHTMRLGKRQQEFHVKTYFPQELVMFVGCAPFGVDPHHPLSVVQ